VVRGPYRQVIFDVRTVAKKVDPFPMYSRPVPIAGHTPLTLDWYRELEIGANLTDFLVAEVNRPHAMGNRIAHLGYTLYIVI
jgi:hypothetical protein